VWIVVSLENALIILVRYHTNMIFSNDTNNLVNYSIPLHMWICHWECIWQSLIWLNCENEYLWPRQREVLYHIIVRWCPFRYWQLGRCYFSYPDTGMWRRTDTPVVGSIRMRIHGSLEIVEIIVVSYCNNVSSSQDTNNLEDTSQPMLIRICCRELIKQFFIQFECEY